MSKEKLIELKEKMLALNKELKESYSNGLKEYATELLSNHKNIEGISWTQYTPYFNDGEPCEFGINADYPSVKVGGQWFDLHDELIVNHYEKPSWKVINKTITEEVAGLITVEEAEAAGKAIREFASDVLYPFEKQLQALLGEGRVLLTKDGVEVEDYNHD